MTHPDPSLLAIADTIAAQLADPAPHEHPHAPQHQSLAAGHAGAALLHAERAVAHPERWNTLHAWLSAATGGALNGSASASLFFGVPALAFVTHAAAHATGRYQNALTRLDATTHTLTRERLATAHERMRRGEHPDLAEFDLLRGLTGLGAYHLLRAPHHDTTAAVLGYLVRLTEPLHDDGRPGWWTEHGPVGQPPADYPGGHGNFGIAHGITGPLALLALALRRGVLVDGHTDAITRICTWLDTWQQPHTHGPWWPRTITAREARTGRCEQPGPLQPSWCYGTPGIARAQQLAALATHDTTRQHTAETALLGCLTDPHQLARITDPSLCHGAAGLLHTTWRTATDSTSDALTAHLPALTALLCQHLDTAPPTNALLEGTTGAALALHAAATGTPPHTSWDTTLLLAPDHLEVRA